MRWFLAYILVISLSLWPWLWLEPKLVPLDGGEGLSVFGARLQPWLMVLLTVLAGAVAVIPVLALAWAGRVVVAVMCYAAGLSILAHRGGGVDGWFHRVSLPMGWLTLVIEVLFWSMLLIGVALLLEWVGRRGSGQSGDRPSGSVADEGHGHADAGPDGLSVCRHSSLVVFGPVLPMLMAGVLAAVIQLVVLGILMASPLLGQAFWSIVLGGVISGVVVHVAFARAALLLVMLAPGVVAILAYAQAFVSFGNTEEALLALYRGGLSGRLLALPIHYMSAGVAATLLGVLIGPAVISTEGNTEPEPERKAA